MKILREQQEYIKNEIENLWKKIAHLHEEQSSNLIGNAKFRETKIIRDSILAEYQKIGILQNILDSSSVVTVFNNEQIDIGTLFKVKFADSEQLAEFTMIDSNIEGKFSVLNGYITKNSPFGQSVYLKGCSTSFSYQVEGKNMIVGEIVEIVPKENIDKDTEKDSVQVSISNQGKSGSLHSFNNACLEFKDYYDKLDRYQKHSKVAEREMARLKSITVSQYCHFLDYYQQLSKEALSYRWDHQSICARLKKIKCNLQQNVLSDIPDFIVDFGTKLILEIEKAGEMMVKELELVPFCYKALADYNDQYLSVKTWMGFSSYKAKMGDYFAIHQFGGRSFTIAQFNVHREKLLLPMSSNLSLYTKEEMDASLERYQYQKENHSMMTLSQKLLLDKEISKISETPKITSYIENLYFLKQSVEEGTILVQTEDEILENGEQIGLGSFVHYDLLVEGKPESKSGEIIACAFTVEENDQYIEEFSPLGKSLIGKSPDDCFEVLVDGKIQKGVVVSVSNQVAVKEVCYKK